MIGQPSPFPWWLWILAGLWTGGVVLRRVWPVGREARWFLDVLIAVYTVLLAYMAATATTGAMDDVGWMRLGWWSCGAIALSGALWCALGATPRGRTIGWCAATAGLAALAAWLHAPEMALLCAAAGVVGALQPSSPPVPSPPSSGERVRVRGRTLVPHADVIDTIPDSTESHTDAAIEMPSREQDTASGVAGSVPPPHPNPLPRGGGEGTVPRHSQIEIDNNSQSPDAWLVAVTATIVCVAWLGALEFALRTESVRAGVSPRVTALPSPERVRMIHGPNSSLPSAGSLLAGVLLGLSILEAWPRRSDAEDRAA